MECILIHGTLTHRQIDCHQQWHGALAFWAHVHLFPALSSVFCGCRLQTVSSIHSHFNGSVGVWQTPWHPPSDLAACHLLSTPPSMTDTLNQLVSELKHNTTGKQPVSCTQGQECCSSLWRSLEKENRGGKHRFQAKSQAECQITSKTATKRHWAMFQFYFYTKALATLSTYFWSAGDTLAVISIRERPLSWQLFQRGLTCTLESICQDC